MIQKERCDLFVGFFADVHGAMHPVCWLLPVRFASSDPFAMSFAAVFKFDIEQITAENNCYAMKRIAMPRSGFSRWQTQASHQIISVMM